jgi:hypothetical protein
VDKALAAWGSPLPDWIKELAEACDASSLRKTATKLGVSAAIISLAINAKPDKERHEFVKDKTERILMVTLVACPVLGVMGKTECLREQAAPYSSANTQRVRLYQACRNGCKHFRGERKEQAALAATKKAARRGKHKEEKA